MSDVCCKDIIILESLVVSKKSSLRILIVSNTLLPTKLGVKQSGGFAIPPFRCPCSSAGRAADF
jgi:hypothetical protein